jgi:signal transduction histidine kinase/ligand-binding sensor domain-containing protein/CheY-like chemotaxis protein
MKLYRLFALFLLVSNVSRSQDASLLFKRLSAENGLSNNWVRCIYQDTTGFIWVGTADGLNRYDGFGFKVFRPTDEQHNSLGDIHINAISRKNNHEFWVCTDMGVYSFDFQKQQELNNLMMNKIPVLCVLEDYDKSVLFGTSRGIYRYNPGNDSITLFNIIGKEESSGKVDNYINTIYQDADSTIWIGTKNGIYQIEKGSGYEMRFEKPAVTEILTGKDIMSICQDKSGRIWVAAFRDGLYILMKDKSGKEFCKRVIGGNITSLMIDYENNLWIGKSSDEGLVKTKLADFDYSKELKLKGYKNHPADLRSISDNSIVCLFEDNLKDIWIGTNEGGLNYFSKREKKFNTVSEGNLTNNTIQSDLVNSFFEEEDYLWIGTEEGLEQLNKKNGRYIQFHNVSDDPYSLGANSVFSILKDKKGNLWIGTWAGGLNLFNYKNKTFRRFLTGSSPTSISSNNIISMLEDRFGNLWISTQGGGLNRYEYSGNTFKRYVHDDKRPQSLYHTSVNDLLETSTGKLYISTYFSLDLFDYKTDSFSHFIYDTSTTGTGGKIISIFEDSRQNIWLTTNRGLEWFNEADGKFIHYFSDSTFSDNVAQGILEDTHGNLWVSTNNGLYKILHGIQKPVKPEFHRFSKADGLSGDEFTKRAAYLSKSGIMYFGSSKGFTYFHPDSILLNNKPPEIVLNEFLLLHPQPNKSNIYKSIPENINVIDKLVLSYKNADFIIRFASLNYLHAEKNQHQYKLEGYDKQWIDAGNERTATYTNMQPGRYTFLVKGSNNDGVWCETPKKLGIIIHPPWWRTLFFRIILLITGLLLVLALYRFRLAFLKKQNLALEQKVKKRTNEISAINAVLQEKQEEIITQNNELEIHRNNLEQLVEERTAELVKAKIKAEESDKLKSSFLANMSHEIRTPMNAIYGFSSLLRDTVLDEDEKKQYLDIIGNNCESLLVLIDDLLDISMIEANNTRITKSFFNVDAVLKDLENQIQLKNIRKLDLENINKTQDKQLVLFNDQARFLQVFNNLLNNALKFTESGYIKFGYSVFEDVVRFFVADTGIGMETDQIGKIFNQFYKIENEAQKQYRGTGIGLTITKKLVNLMGGDIWVESIVNSGSIFYFTLPNEQENAAIMKNEIAEPKKLFWLKELTILIAEDDPTNYRLLTAMLKSSGSKIQWAHDGQEAIDFIKKKPADEKCIVLMDIKMPIINGYEATRQIKKIDESILVIAVTAYALLQDREKIMNYKFDGYISKPFNLETLLSVLSKFATNID